MVVDKHTIQACHPALQLIRRLLDGNDDIWVHESAGVDQRLIRQFRAQRRRSFYGCIGEIRGEARLVQQKWRAAAESLQDYSGVDWPLEVAKFHLRLGWICLVAECHFRFGLDLRGATRQNLFNHLDRAADFTFAASVSN